MSRRSTTERLPNENVRSPIHSVFYSKSLTEGVDEPFYVTNIKVGAFLLLIGSLFYVVIMVITTSTYSPKQLGNKWNKYNVGNTKTFMFGSSLPRHLDPYGITEQYLERSKLPQPNKDTIDFGSLLHLFLPQSEILRNEFASQYGGQRSARAMLQRGIRVIQTASSNKHDGLISLIQRLQHASQAKKSFRIVVTGSSVPSGGYFGNSALTSYAMGLDHLISAACSALGINLVVQNAAVEKNAEFPWTWCLGNFVYQQEHYQPSIDVMIWDFGSTTLPSFESYLRHAATINPRSQPPPLLIFRASSSIVDDVQYQTLLQSYAEAGILHDPILIHVDNAAEPFLALPESQRPPGFLASDSSFIENTSWSIQQQGELMAWLIVMFFLSALEYIAADSIAPDHAKLLPQTTTFLSPLTYLPPPISISSISSDVLTWMPLVMGKPDHNNKSWKLTRPQCHTSFDSIVANNLQDLIVSGCSVGENKTDPSFLLRPKSAMFYNSGWVLDLDLELKRAKRLQNGKKSDLVDIKKAYYGVSTSGTLKIFVPVTTMEKHSDKSRNNNEMLLIGRDYVDTLVVCEFTSTHRPDGCQFSKDVTFQVDGKPALSQAIPAEIVTNTNNACVQVEIPIDAYLARRELFNNNIPTDEENLNGALNDLSFTKDTTLGLVLEIQVSNERLTWDKGPCSVAQVILQAKEKKT